MVQVWIVISVREHSVADINPVWSEFAVAQFSMSTFSLNMRQSFLKGLKICNIKLYWLERGWG